VLLSVGFRKAGFVVGIKLRGDGVTTVICDLAAQIVVTQELHVPLWEIRRLPFHGHRDRGATEQFEPRGCPRAKVLGVGVRTFGIIDTNRGTCNFSHLLNGQMSNSPNRFVAIWVCRCGLRMTSTRSPSQKNGLVTPMTRVTLSFLTVGRGIGLGIVIDRSLYRGANGATGEFGHMIVDPGGPRVNAADSGALKAMVGEKTPLRRRVGERQGRENLSR